jgi:hypothetical protein
MLNGDPPKTCVEPGCDRSTYVRKHKREGKLDAKREKDIPKYEVICEIHGIVWEN